MNRVKAMRSKFEQTETNKSTNNVSNNSLNSRNPKRMYLSKSADDNQTNLVNIENSHLNLNRQLSDPVKVNIKRTPAFRLDKNSISLQENLQFGTRSKNVSSRVKLFDRRLKENNCDSNDKFCNNNNNSDEIINFEDNKVNIDVQSEVGNVSSLRNKFSNDSSKYNTYIIKLIFN